MYFFSGFAPFLEGSTPQIPTQNRGVDTQFSGNPSPFLAIMLLPLFKSEGIKSHEVLSLLGPAYRMVQLFVNPGDVGHAGISRPRTYIFYYNVFKTEYVYDVFELYNSISHEIQKVVQTEPYDYFITEYVARCVDEMNMARKRQRVYQPVPQSNLNKFFTVCVFFWMGSNECNL